jgi:hypothetical protein
MKFLQSAWFGILAALIVWSGPAGAAEDEAAAAFRKAAEAGCNAEMADMRRIAAESNDAVYAIELMRRAQKVCKNQKDGGPGRFEGLILAIAADRLDPCTFRSDPQLEAVIAEQRAKHSTIAYRSRIPNELIYFTKRHQPEWQACLLDLIEQHLGLASP